MESILGIIPSVIGLGLIDENLSGLLDAMQNKSPVLGLGYIMTWAKVVGLGIALGVGANECYQMMLGRKGLDVMKILHIIIISICISSAGTITSIASIPGRELENITRSSMKEMSEEVNKREKEVAALQEGYLDKVRESMRQIEMARDAEKEVAKEDPKWWEYLATPGGMTTGTSGAQAGTAVVEEVKHVKNTLKEYTLMAETKICEWLSLIIRLIGELILQAIYYGLLVSQRIFMHILGAFSPLMFAMSLSPHYKSAWSQWLSKYLSISLWGFLVYACMYYVYFILWYNLDQDVASYTKLTGDLSKDNYQIAAIGMQALGSTCMYVVGLLVGVKVLSFVPEVASWLIPGGVSSGAGSAAYGVATGGASKVGGTAVASASNLARGSMNLITK